MSSPGTGNSRQYLPETHAYLTLLPLSTSANRWFPVLSSFILEARYECQEELMNWDQVQGKWKQIKGEAKTRWGKLTDDDLDTVGGQRDQLIGRIQERYGIAKDQAQREVEDWNRTLDRENDSARIEQQRERKAS